MVNLYYNFYVDKLKERNDELNFCLSKLFENEFIDKYLIVLSKKDEKIFDRLCKKNVKKIYIETRPTYKDFFLICKLYTKEDDINILLNSDCYIKESDTKRLYNMNKDHFYCISRWDIEKLSPTFVVNKKSINKMSQDAWIWKGHIKPMNSDFKLGIKACDNAIAYQIQNAGYKPRNIPYYIRIYHYHFTYENRMQDWYKENYDNEPILFVDVEELNMNKIEDTNDKIENEKKLEELKITRTIKDICNEMLINPGDFRIYMNDIILFDTEKEGKNKLQFEDDYIMINSNKISYRNIRIKRII